MESRRSPLIVVGVILVLAAVSGFWYFTGSRRIISAVPDESTTDRVILVTPQATPTVEVVPTDILSPTPDKVATPSPTKKAAAPTAKPTVAATKAAATPTKAAATVTPAGSTPSPTGSSTTPTKTPTPTP